MTGRPTKVDPDHYAVDQAIRAVLHFFLRLPDAADIAVWRHTESGYGRCVQGCDGAWPCLSAEMAREALSRHPARRIPKPRRPTDGRG